MASTCWMYNGTGADLPKGSVVVADATGTKYMKKSVAGSAVPVGVTKRLTPNGQWGEVVVSGLAQVLITAAATNGYWLQASDSVDGQADAAAAAPGLVLEHFDEIGHLVETIGGAGLGWAVVHFN